MKAVMPSALPDVLAFRKRTKTDGTTRRTLTLIWGTNALAGRSAETEEWYRSLLDQHDASTRSAWR